MTAGRALVVDDDADLLGSVLQSMKLAGLAAQGFGGGLEALEHISGGFDGVVVTDIRMPDLDGMSLMTRIREIDPDIPVILITGHGDVPLAVRAMREGAHDFIEKPFSGAHLASLAARALDFRQLVLDNRRLRAVAGQADDLETRLVGRSAAMIDLRRRIRTIGPTDADVLIEGPTGAGKDLVARTLHDLSPRRDRPFVAIACSALPATMIESELFGHDPGAFPGAIRARMGRFEHARGGTILLDDIGAMPIDLQARLLRVIEERMMTPMGSNSPIPLDVRFMATSRTPLDHEVEAGRFRPDLLYRLNVVSLRVPALAERPEDVPALFDRLLAEAHARHRLPDRPASPDLLAEMARRDWPGNVRELRNAAERVALGLADPAAAPAGGEGGAAPTLADLMAEHERRILIDALIRHRGVLKPVYETLGLSRKTLYDKLVRHGIDKTRFVGSDEGM